MSEEKRMYPCDEPEKKAYPCDEPEKKAYPCDEPEEPARRNSFARRDGGEQISGEARERIGGEKRDKAGGDAGAEEARPAGKGRRGGNAAASVVVHSGKAPRYQKREEQGDQSGRGTKNGSWREGRSEGRGQRSHENGSWREERGDRRDFGGRGTGAGSSAGRRDHSERRGGGFSHREDRPYGRGDRKEGARSAPRRSFEENEEFEALKELTVIKTTEIGAFVDYEGQSVLLPFSEQTERPKAGDRITVRLYGDKGGRLTATMREPILKTGEVGILRVADTGKIGAFLDNGMPKQVLLPYREQVVSPKKGDEVLVCLYEDKSGRTAATMRVYKHLDSHSPYKKDDTVKGFVYEISESLGVFVAVDDRYFGLISSQEVYGDYHYGDRIEARVVRVREDGKLDLAVREKSYLSLDQDARAILDELDRNGGKLPYADRADAALIEDIYRMSKNQFKRALGHLYRQRLVEIDRVNGTVTRVSGT